MKQGHRGVEWRPHAAPRAGPEEIWVLLARHFRLAEADADRGEATLHRPRGQLPDIQGSEQRTQEQGNPSR